MDWFLKLKARPHCPDAEKEFQSWLLISAMHERAFAQALKTWTLIGEAPPVYEHLWRSAPAVAPPPPRPNRRAPWVAGAALLLAACVLVVLAGPHLLIRWQADHVTMTAENRTVTLEDGTVIELGAESAISTDITVSGRHVALLAGEAFFDVAHDPTRPFTVDAGGVSVQALGTAFDVKLDDEETTVELARGAVALSYDILDQKKNFELSPGEMATIHLATGNVMRDSIAPEDIAAWRSGKMFVNDVTVGAAVQSLQRYHPSWIRFADPALSSRRVTGLYDLRNPDGALEALVKPFGGKVRAITAYGRMLTRF